MKISILHCVLLLLVCAVCQASPTEDKAFTDKYKQAFEGKDTATLNSFLYTTGADPQIVSFFQMMMTAEAGSKISKIDLVALTPEEVQKASGPLPSPDGSKVCLVLKPTKKLVIQMNAKDGEGSSSATSQNFVAEKDGKLVIPVPGPCK